MKKRIIALAIATLLCLSVLPLSAAAATDYNALYNHVVNNLENDVLAINVLSYNVTEDDLQLLVQDVFDNEPQLFYLTGLSYGTMGSKISTIYYFYAIEDATQRKNAIKLVNDELDAIVATLPKGLDTLETAMYFHDYICINYEYDTDYEIYDVYNMLKNGEGVCQAYTGVYDLLLERVGIENRTASSSNHIWNQVKINGKWYNIDTTWGDPTPNSLGRATHSNAMQSNASFLESHGSFTYEYNCNDTTYESYSWVSQSIPFGFSNGDTYMANGKYIQKIDLATDAATTVYTINDTWRTANGYYSSAFSGMGSFDDNIVFNNSAEILIMDKNGNVSVLYSPELPVNNCIYGLYVSKGNQSIVYKYGPDFYNQTYVEIPISDLVSEKIKGDINSDGSFDMFDYMELKAICNGQIIPDSATMALCDINSDGAIDMFDYVELKIMYFAK